jgi:hypothetical protein
MSTLDWWALILGCFLGGLIASYKFLPNRIFREMDEDNAAIGAERLQ